MLALVIWHEHQGQTADEIVSHITNPPGFGFHPLRGDRKGEYAISVTGNSRMAFRFQGGDVLDLNLEDYH